MTCAHSGRLQGACPRRGVRMRRLRVRLSAEVTNSLTCNHSKSSLCVTLSQLIQFSSRTRVSGGFAVPEHVWNLARHLRKSMRLRYAARELLRYSFCGNIIGVGFGVNPKRTVW